jgi:hypothetical protein
MGPCRTGDRVLRSTSLFLLRRNRLRHNQPSHRACNFGMSSIRRILRSANHTLLPCVSPELARSCRTGMSARRSLSRGKRKAAPMWKPDLSALRRHHLGAAPRRHPLRVRSCRPGIILSHSSAKPPRHALRRMNCAGSKVSRGRLRRDDR